MGLRWAERTKLLILLISVIFTGDLILINQIASENHFFSQGEDQLHLWRRKVIIALKIKQRIWRKKYIA